LKLSTHFLQVSSLRMHTSLPLYKMQCTCFWSVNNNTFCDM
jgi:hypothetical protein